MAIRSLFLVAVLALYFSQIYGVPVSDRNNGAESQQKRGVSSRLKSPPAAHVYWGALVSGFEWDNVTSFEKHATNGKKVSAIHFGGQWFAQGCSGYCNFYTQDFENAVNNGAFPVFSWGSTCDSTGNPAEFTPAAIARGAQDAYLTQWARDAAAFGHPLVVVLDWEMNGNWYTFAPKKGSSVTAASYIAMWRHIVTLFRQNGAHNVYFAWVPNIDPKGYWAKQSGYPLHALYPGDEFVDVVGLDGYNFGGSSWTSFQALFYSTYRLITTEIAPKKTTFMIKEVGSVERGGSKAHWISSMFSVLPKKFPRIKILLWYDEDAPDPTTGGVDNWPIESSKSSAHAFARGVASSRYLAGNAHNLNAAKSRLRL